MHCNEHATLLLEYKTRTDVYKLAVRKLTEHAVGIPQVEFMLMWKLANLAEQKCEATRRSLLQHIEDHDC